MKTKETTRTRRLRAHRLAATSCRRTSTPRSASIPSSSAGRRAREPRGSLRSATEARRSRTIVVFDASLGFPSHWVTYVSVEDVDDACERASGLGGACCQPGFDAPGVGRFAIAHRPGEALTKPIRLASGDPSFDASPGRFVWDELLTKDPRARARFLRGALLLDALRDGRRPGDLPARRRRRSPASAPRPPRSPGARGSPRSASSRLDAVLERSRARLGAKLLREPASLPHVGRSALLEDPAGALVGFLETRGEARGARRAAAVKNPASPKKTAAAPAPTFTPRELFARLGERFDAEAARGVRGVVQYELAGDRGGSWFRRLRGRHAPARRGRARFAHVDAPFDRRGLRPPRHGSARWRLRRSRRDGCWRAVTSGSSVGSRRC